MTARRPLVLVSGTPAELPSGDTLAGGGAGDVVGPASATDNRLARFKGTSGKEIDASQIEEDDSGNVGIGGDPLAGGTGTLKVGTGYTLTNHANTTLTANSIAVTTTTPWAASAYSGESFVGDVSATAKIADDGYIILGLNADPATDTNWTSLDYGCYFHVNEMYYVESGVSTIASPAVGAAVGDEIGIRRVGTTIEYLHNGAVFRTTTGVSSATPLYLDTAFDPAGYTGTALTGITFGPPDTVKARAEGTVEARAFRDLRGYRIPANMTAAPTALSILVFAGTDGDVVKGTPVTITTEGDIRSGNELPHYGDNTVLALGGALNSRNGWVRCLQADSNDGIGIYYLPAYGGALESKPPPVGDGGTDWESYFQGWNGADYKYETQFGDMVFRAGLQERVRITHDSRLLVRGLTLSFYDFGDCTSTADSITRASGGGAWDASSISNESYFGDVAVFTTLSGTAATAAIGLNALAWQSNTLDSIDYAIKLEAGVLYVVESGAAIYTGPGFVIGDRIGVSRVGTTVEYSKNGTVFHTTTGVSAGIPLWLDTSFYASGMTFSAITFAPPDRARVEVAGVVESTSGGFKFPDGSTQATAAAGTGGVTTVDFGAFPGKSDASVTVTGQTDILAGSRVKAWIQATATSDHSADEHWLESIDVTAGSITAATGFIIYAKNTGTLNEPVVEQWANARLAGPGTGINQTRPDTGGGKGTRLYGQFTVAWEWI